MNYTETDAPAETISPPPVQAMSFTVIDAAGEIVSQLSVPDEEHAAMNTPAGCTAIVGVAPYPEGWWDGAEWHDRPAPPEKWCTWDTAIKTWVDARDIDQARLDQWAAVKAGRDATIFGTFTWDGSVFDANGVSQQRIQGAVQLALISKAANQGFSIDWTLADNTVRTLSGDDMIAVGLALGGFMQTNFEHGQALRSQIEAAQTLDAVMAIDWTPAG